MQDTDSLAEVKAPSCGVPRLLRRSTSIYQRRRRAGTSLAELVVAGTLLLAATGVVATSAVGGHRLARLEKQNRIAADEISNQLERLSILPATEVQSALRELSVNPWAAQSLIEAELTGRLIDDEYGQRIELSLQWQRPGESKPLSAVVWLSEQNSAAGDTQ